MRKNAPLGAKLYYGQIRAMNRISFDQLCAEVSRTSTASRGDVQLVIATALECMKDHMAQGDIIQMGELGNFRLSVGSSGATTEAGFSTTLFKKGRVVFTPGSMLRTTTKEISFEKLTPLKSETGGIEEPEGGL